MSQLQKHMYMYIWMSAVGGCKISRDNVIDIGNTWLLLQACHWPRFSMHIVNMKHEVCGWCTIKERQAMPVTHEHWSMELIAISNSCIKEIAVSWLKNEWLGKWKWRYGWCKYEFPLFKYRSADCRGVIVDILLF